MNADDLLERQLSAHLLGHAAQAPGGDGWDGILSRVEQRHRRRQRRRIGVTTLGAVALVAVLVSLGAGSPSDDSHVATNPAESSSRLPHLVLDLPPGYELAHVSETYLAAESPTPESASPDGLRLSVLAQPGRGYDGRVLFVTTAGPRTGYGVGDKSPVARSVDVAGNAGWLQQYTGLPATSLGWYLPSGQAVHLVALRMGDAELLAAGRSIVVAQDGTVSWRDGQSPDDLVLERSSATPTGPRASAEVQYVRGSERMTLRIQEGGDAVLDDLVRDRAAAALEMGETTVAGVPAVMAVYDGEKRTILMWQIRPGVVAELVASNTSASPIITEAVSTIRSIDEPTWQELLDRFAVAPSDPGPGQPTGEQVAAVVRSMCELRAEWLAAAAGTEQAEIDRLLRNLRRHAVEVGVERNTDVVSVMDRLLTAMSAGDRALVLSIPEGGACR